MRRSVQCSVDAVNSDGDTSRGVEGGGSAVGTGLVLVRLGLLSTAPRFGWLLDASRRAARRLAAGSESHGSGPPGRDETVQGPETQDQSALVCARQASGEKGPCPVRPLTHALFLCRLQTSSSPPPPPPSSLPARQARQQGRPQTLSFTPSMLCYAPCKICSANSHQDEEIHSAQHRLASRERRGTRSRLSFLAHNLAGWHVERARGSGSCAGRQPVIHPELTRRRPGGLPDVPVGRCGAGAIRPSLRPRCALHCAPRATSSHLSSVFRPSEGRGATPLFCLSLSCLPFVYAKEIGEIGYAEERRGARPEVCEHIDYAACTAPVVLMGDGLMSSQPDRRAKLKGRTSHRHYSDARDQAARPTRFLRAFQDAGLDIE